MKTRQNHWYVVREERALDFEARGFKIKQKHNGKWMVLCHPSELLQHERENKGMVPRGVMPVSLEDPAELHNVLKGVFGE